jgi:hypothetical protein
MGMGTYGSRSLAVGGSAIVKATNKIIDKAKKIAAHLLEAAPEDIELKDGKFSVAGTDKSVDWSGVTLAAYVPHNYPLEELEPGLEETAFYDPSNFTYPSGAYGCEVELDPETGKIDILRFIAADDFGNIVNPMIVEGQVHGGLAQGIGQALLENCVYDDQGQLLSGSYMDYTMPRADDMRGFTVDHSCVTPCTHNPLGVKGCGEAGAIGSPPAVVNAAIDALHRAGFLAYLRFVAANLNGQTAIAVMPAWASQTKVIEGVMGQAPLHHLFRTEWLARDLPGLGAGLGLDLPAFAPVATPRRFTLAGIYDAEIEAAGRAAYGLDYEALGFEDWRS